MIATSTKDTFTFKHGGVAFEFRHITVEELRGFRAVEATLKSETDELITCDALIRALSPFCVSHSAEQLGGLTYGVIITLYQAFHFHRQLSSRDIAEVLLGELFAGGNAAGAASEESATTPQSQAAR